MGKPLNYPTNIGIVPVGVNRIGMEWTSATWNPVAGCSVVSPGCKHCYAMKMAARIEAMQAALGKPTHYVGLTQPGKAGAVWTGRMAVAPDETMTQPLRWKKPRRIFVNSMSDLFHEEVADETIDRVFAVMALCPQHTFQILTKRAKRMREYLTRIDSEPVADTARRIAAAWPDNAAIPPEITFPLPNVWLGVSTEDQERADERIPELLATPAARRFISAEPLLGPVDLTCVPWPAGWTRPIDDISDGINPLRFNRARLDWVIAGGESGPGARPMHPDWVRSLRDQCAAAKVPFFFKQWGEWAIDLGPGAMPESGESYTWIGRNGRTYNPSAPQDQDCWAMRRVGKKAAGATLDGKMHREFPT